MNRKQSYSRVSSISLAGTLILVFALAVGFTPLGGVASAQASSAGIGPLLAPSNDDFSSPKVITSLPYPDNMDVTAATKAPDDPNLVGCYRAAGLASVWYSYTPSAGGVISVDTFGSNYDTMVGAWTGSRGSLTEVGCNDDAPGGLQSLMKLQVTAGVTYYIEVSQFQSSLTGPAMPKIGKSSPSGDAASLLLVLHVNPATTVNVTIGGTLQGTYALAFSEQMRVNYAGLDSGPVVVHSLKSVPIISALRDAWVPQNGTATTSFAQLMGLPAGQLSDTYYFPSYNNVTLDEQLRFGNVGGTDTTVTVTIGGVVQGSYLLHPSEQMRVNYAGLDSGPVVVQSSGAVPIIAALRDAWVPPGQIYTTSITQLMGLPAGQLSDTYYFPSYNNVTLDEQLRVGNVGNVDTAVTVTIAGTPYGTYPLHPSEQVRVNYAGVDSGPVIVHSSGGVPIIAALRDAWVPQGGTTTTSYAQLMGLPAGLLSDKYVFPSYNNVTLNEQLRFGNVGGTDTTVTVTIGGYVEGAYLLHPNQQMRINYAGVDTGPVIVQSSGGVKITAALRDAWVPQGGTATTSFIQLMGLPAGQLSDTYYFPSYNNVTLNEQLRFAAP